MALLKRRHEKYNSPGLSKGNLKVIAQIHQTETISKIKTGIPIIQFYHINKRPAKIGNSWYHDNGFAAVIGESCYYSNGQTAKIGQDWFYENGRPAKIGRSFYF